MENKKIIILIGVIFLALVGYKIISSNIQKNKEEAVLQEKYQLDQLQKNQDEAKQQKITDQLNACLADAETKMKESMLIWTNYGNKCSGSVSAQTYCLTLAVGQEDNVKIVFNQDKEECYKRYK